MGWIFTERSQHSVALYSGWCVPPLLRSVPHFFRLRFAGVVPKKASLVAVHGSIVHASVRTCCLFSHFNEWDLFQSNKNSMYNKQLKCVEKKPIQFSPSTLWYTIWMRRDVNRVGLVCSQKKKQTDRVQTRNVWQNTLRWYTFAMCRELFFCNCDKH